MVLALSMVFILTACIDTGAIAESGTAQNIADTQQITGKLTATQKTPTDMRANKTASTYNNFILENSYVWSGNVPDDINDTLEYIE